MTPSIKNQITATFNLSDIKHKYHKWPLSWSLGPTNLGPKLRVKQTPPKQKTIPVKLRALGIEAHQE